MDALKRFTIVDLDGTIYKKFKLDDKNIISKMFENNILINIVNNFLWAINSLDYFTNNMFILNLRFRIFAIISFKSLDEIKKEYQWRYRNLLKLNLQSKEDILQEISKTYNIIIVTSNKYAIKVLIKKFNYDVIYAANYNSRLRQIKEKHITKNISYIVGNNYNDDILLAKKIKASSIYVGNSLIKKFFNANHCISDFDYNLIEILKR